MPGLKARIHAGEAVIGTWLTLPSPSIAEIASRAGFDWVAVDLEHTTLGLESAAELIRVADLCGAAPLCRLSGHDPVQVKRLMDAGAHGVIAPMVTRPEQVEQLHRWMHYPPDGERGVGLGRAQGYGAGFHAYREWLRTEAVLVAQIEHVEALDHLDAIFSHPSLDAFMVGPYDLSASMGRPGDFGHPEYADALMRIRAAGHRAGKAAGIHVVEPRPEELATRLAEGYGFLAYGVDFRMIDAACRAGLHAIGR